MSRSDLLIQNETWANVRTDVQGVQQAIATKNSGTGEPEFTYPFMGTVNAADGKLRLRNESDDANIPYFNPALPLQHIKAVDARKLVAAFDGDGVAAAYSVTLPSGISSVNYSIEASLADTIGTGYYLTIFSSNNSLGAAGGLSEYYAGLEAFGPLVTQSVPTTGSTSYLYLYRCTGACEVLSSRGVLRKAPSGRLCLKHDTFEIASGNVRATDGASWSIPYSPNISSVIVRAYTYDRVTTKALPNTFHMSFYV